MSTTALGLAGPLTRAKSLLVLSFMPLLLKALDYASIGGYVPLMVFVVFGGLVGAGVFRGARAAVIAVKIWAIALISWGSTRLALLVLAKLTSLDEAYLLAQFTAWYIVLSLGHIVLGILLFRVAKG